jgi:hypothetical protein
MFVRKQELKYILSLWTELVKVYGYNFSTLVNSHFSFKWP